jgi:hypothetical protein
MSTYEETWGSEVGKDCVDLCSTLPRWLGARLTFLGNHTSGCPLTYFETEAEVAQGVERWQADLTRHGAALTHWADADDWTDEEADRALADAQDALRWVATNLQALWD